MFSPAISRVDPRLMMLNCDMSGVYLSHDGGFSWSMIDGRQLRSDIHCRPAFHPTDRNIIFAAQAGIGLKKSIDGGNHWKVVPAPTTDLQGEIAIDPKQPECLLIGDSNSIYQSSDAGATWVHRSGPQGSALAFHFDQTSRGGRRVEFAATTMGIWRSNDAGATWVLKSSALGTHILSFCGGSNPRKDRCVIYASCPSQVSGGKLSGGVFRSLDRGETWESCMGGGINVETTAYDEWAHGPVAQYAWVLTCDANPDIVWAFNSNTGVPPPHHTAAYRSGDGGHTWKPTFYPDPRFPGFNCDREFMTTVAGQYYQGVPLGVAIDPGDGDRVIQADGSYCFVTTNGGKSWRTATSPYGGESSDTKEPRWKSNGLVVTTAWNYDIDPFESARRYICYTDIGFARSLDRDEAWIWWSRNGRAPWVNTTYELAFDPEIPGKMWGAFSESHDIPNYNAIGGGHQTDRPGGVCVSTNFAATWQTANQGLPNHAALSVVVDPHSPNASRTLYASVFGDGVFKSTDGGGSWKLASDGLADTQNRRVCRLQLHSDGTLFVLVTGKKDRNGRWAAGAGLYRSNDGAQSWEKVNPSQEFAWPKDFIVDPVNSRITYVGACDANGQEQGGLWRTTDAGTTWKRLLRKGSEHFGAYLHPRHPGWIYATLTEGPRDSGLWLSKDDGDTWTPMNLPFSNAMRVSFDPSDDGVIYVSTFGGSVWKGPSAE